LSRQHNNIFVTRIV